MREMHVQSSRSPAGIRNRPARRFSRLARCLAVAVVVAAAAGCGSQHGAAGQAGESEPVVVVAAVPAPGAAALYIAEEQGLFARAGLEVRIESSVSAADVLPDLVNGSVAVALGQWTSALDAAAGGVKITAVGPGNSGAPGLEELVTAAGSGATRVAQLRGKTVAVNALAGLPQALTDAVLEANGVSPSAVRYTAIPFPSMAAALSAKRVAAAFMVQPYAEESVASHQVNVLADMNQDSATRGIPVTGYYAAQAWARAHPAELTSFRRALAEGQRIAAADPATARQAIARYTGVTPPVASKMALGVFSSSVSVAGIERVGWLMQQYRLLPRTVNVAALATGMTS